MRFCCRVTNQTKPKTQNKTQPATGIAIRVYGVVLAFLIVFTELGWTRAVRETPLLQNWVSRGSIYAL